MTLVFALAAYAAAMVAANLFVAKFGLWVVPVNAFLFIGLDLTLRDWLQSKITRSQMLLLIVGSGALTYALNPAAAQIAGASAAAFILAAVADWLTFTSMRGSWLQRANGSNVVGAAVDSAAFQWLAFHGVDPTIFAQMFAAKILGGAAWSALLARR